MQGIINKMKADNKTTKCITFQPMNLSFRNLSNKFSNPSRNLCRRRVHLACRYELEGGTQPAHTQLFQSLPLRPTRDDATAAFFHSG